MNHKTQAGTRHSSVCNQEGGEINHSGEGFSHTGGIGHNRFSNKVLD